MSALRVRLADWRDREPIQNLRTLCRVGVDGGLWELLNWPIYHVHTAVIDGQTIGFAAAQLLPDQIVEGVGLAVYPEYRRQGVATILRLTQLRDLHLMGWQYFFEMTPKEWVEGLRMAERDFQAPVWELTIPGTPPALYFGDTIPDLQTRIQSRTTSEPYPLREDKHFRLKAKSEQAARFLADLRSRGMLEAEKYNVRQKAIV